MKHVGTMVLFACAVAACGPDDGDDGDDEGSPDQVGSVCEAPADCYPEIDQADIVGAVLCLDRVRAGYCTHECTQDEDCCAVEGECVTEFPQVCSPFESTDDLMCFLSCEPEVIDAAGSPDEQSFCHDEVSADFICRSSGGGSDNRKVCVPGDCGVGASCGGDADCDVDLECIDDFDGGYCGHRGCAVDSECPQDSACIDIDGDSYCVKRCSTDGDCGLCRSDDAPAACTADVVFLDPDGTGSVCLGDRD